MTDGGFPIIDAAPPAATSTLLYGGDVLLLAPGFACSRAATPAAGAAAPDKWCAFVKPADAMQTTFSLYVFNLTKTLAAGTPLTCAAGDANCFQLNSSLFIDQTAAHGFYGQTLIYYDAQAAYAWRPGWTAGRMILPAPSGQPAHCEGSPADVPTAICIQFDVTGTTENVYAGSVATQMGTALPIVEGVGDASTGVGFSPDSLSVLYSIGSSTGPIGETLKMQTIGDDTSRKMIATNVTNWTLAPDGTKWYWEAAPAVDSNGLTLGTLQVAPYPAGTSPVNLQGKTLTYAPYGPKGMVSLSTPTNTGADLKVISDVASPTTTTTVLQAKTAFGLMDVSSTGEIIYFDDVQQPDPSQNVLLYNIRAVKADNTGKCVVSADALADRSASITTADSGVAWIQVEFDASGNLAAINGMMTTLADCMPHKFSSDVVSYTDVSTGLMYQENLDTVNSTADLAYALYSAAGVMPPMKIQAAADPTFEALQPDLARAVFSINGRASGNGIYVSPMLTGTPTADLKPVVRTIASPLAKARTLQPVTGIGRVGQTGSAPSRFSPFNRRQDQTAAARAFSRFTAPRLLRRPAGP